MFKLSIPITKSFQKKNGKFIVEGIASDPTIDRDEERFDEEAIAKMVKGVNGGSLPIRIEHEDKVYTDVGTWTKASMVDDKLYVKGEIDTEMSLGKDISVLLKRGTPLSLSVGGKVLDAVYEYVTELGKNIKIYKDVILEEISVVKNPSNYNTSLAMAKSVDWEKSKDEVEYTTQAQQLIDTYKSISKIDADKFVEVSKDEEEVKATKDSFNTWMAEVEPKVISLFKDYYEDECYCEDEYRGLTPEDLKLIAQLTTILSEVDLPDDNTWPAIFDDDAYWENLTEEMQIVLFNRTMTMPHHNTDFSVNKELLLYQLKKVVDGVGWYTPKEYTAIVNHLYIHLKKLQIVKSKTMLEKPKDNMSDIKKHIAEQDISKEQLNLLQSCHNFSVGKTTVVPSNEGKEMTKEEIAKCFEAYKELLKSPHFNQIINQSETMDKTTKKVEEKTEVEETPVKKEETTEEKTETTEVEKADSATEEEETTEETSEEKADSETEEEETKEEEVEEEKEEEKEEEVEEKEEETTEEEAPVEDAEVEKKLTKSITANVEKSMVARFDKSLKKLTEIVDVLVTKSEDVTATEDINGLKKDIGAISETLELMSKASLGRKSYATNQVVEKSFTEGALNKTEQEQIDAGMKKGDTFTEAYKAVLAKRV